MKHLLILCISTLLLSACSKGHTEKLLWDKKWEVYNVTPPASDNFDLEAANRARDLKNGFYNGAWFQFTRYGLFRAAFGGKVDSGKYTISYDGKVISLYPLQGNKMYEQLQIQHLTKEQFDFNTVIADFKMTLHTRRADAPASAGKP